MILVPSIHAEDLPFSEEDVLVLGRNLSRVLCGDQFPDCKVSPFIGRGSNQAVGLRIKPDVAAFRAIDLFRYLTPTSCQDASKL